MPSVQDGLISRILAKSTSSPAVLPQCSQKRKYEEGEDIYGVGERFEIRVRNDDIKHTQHDAGASPSVLTPLLLLPRSCLPLAYLDTCGTASFGGPSRLFSAHIPALEGVFPAQEAHTSPPILIAESNNSLLFAIERVRPGTYAQCKLASWIRLNHLAKIPVSDNINPAPTKQPRSSETEEWWLGIIAETQRRESPSVHQRTSIPLKKTGLDLRKPGYVSAAPISPLDDMSLAEPMVSYPSATAHSVDRSLQEHPTFTLEHASQNPNDLLSSVKIQYTESLYRSKASLAYFAKGPLSRARAGCSDMIDGVAGRQCLVEYLRTLIVPLPLLDKKYRETLPSLITNLPNSNMSEDERNEVLAKCKKNSRKSKKEKFGKNGLYPQEEVDVLNWWLDHVASGSACESSDLMAEMTKTTILEQKTRETLLQIILVLEVLALETVLPIASVEKDPKTEPENVEPSRKKPKAKKAIDLSLLLDLSIDRLCIWQSTVVENGDSSEKISDAERTSVIKGLSSKKQDANPLRDFCIDVVLPFYAARLPELSRSLCKKLGGPLPHSQTGPAPTAVGTSSMRRSKPGAAVERPQPRPAGRTLERVLTDDKTFRNPKPSFARSATDSVLPSLKREPSEVSLSNVSLNRPALHESRRYSQREVDFAAISQAKESRIKKKAIIQQELQGAIAVLKKPNPRMAVKEFVESVERRATGGKSKKSKNPVRNPFAPSVQIMATPSANRRRDVYASQPSQLQKPVVMQEEAEEIPLSSCTRVPASVVKTPAGVQVGRGSAMSRRGLMGTIEQTPTRRPSKLSRTNGMRKANLDTAEQAIAATPSSVRTARHPASVLESSQTTADQPLPESFGVRGTLARKASTGLETRPAWPAVEGGPVKPLGSVSANVAGMSKNMTSSPIQKADPSIYQSLGWDDDVDELL
ncbi:MAG: hypothetical protein Q9200_006149 [Gallowayella weberi]